MTSSQINSTSLQIVSDVNLEVADSTKFANERQLTIAAGKKTFNSFLSKAKDKYAQTAQQRALQAQGSSQHSQGGGSDSGIKIGGFKLPNIPSPWQGGTGFKPGEKPMSPEREELRSGALSPDSRSSVMKDYSQSPSRPNYMDRRNSSDGQLRFTMKLDNRFVLQS